MSLFCVRLSISSPIVRVTGSMSEFDSIHVNPYPDCLPPPWYRPPPGVTKGPKRISNSIVFGLLINNEECHAWFKKTYDIELKSNHSQDITIPIRLNKLVIEKDMAFGCSPAPRRLEPISDYIVITQIESGPFIHDGPETYDEVLQEDRRPIPGLKEEKIKAWLEEEIGIKTNGYKSYYSNRYL